MNFPYVTDLIYYFSGYRLTVLFVHVEQKKKHCIFAKL